MFVVDLNAHYYLHSEVSHYLRISVDDDFIVNTIFNEVEKLLRDESYSLTEAENNINDKFNFEFDFLAALKKFDDNISNSPYSARWRLENEGDDFIEAEHVPELSKQVFSRLKESSDFVKSLFYYQFLTSTFLSGVVNFNEIELDFSVYEAFKPKAIIHILQKEYVGGTIKSVPNHVEPIDISGIPEYLLRGNDQIMEKDGKVYLKIDIMQAITSAGGLAQSLERQDLEGKVTNANDKSDNKRRKSSESVDNEASEDSDGATKV